MTTEFEERSIELSYSKTTTFIFESRNNETISAEKIAKINKYTQKIIDKGLESNNSPSLNKEFDPTNILRVTISSEEMAGKEQALIDDYNNRFNLNGVAKKTLTISIKSESEFTKSQIIVINEAIHKAFIKESQNSKKSNRLLETIKSKLNKFIVPKKDFTITISSNNNDLEIKERVKKVLNNIWFIKPIK